MILAFGQKANLTKSRVAKGGDTFVIKDNYWAFIQDFDITEDKLDLNGLSEGFYWDAAGDPGGMKTIVFGVDNDEREHEVARFEGVADLPKANLV